MKKLLFVIQALITLEAIAATSGLCPGEQGYYFENYRHRNPQRGGFVANTAYIGEHVFLAPSAAICGNANVDGQARILGTSVITGFAFITDNVRIQGNITVKGSTSIEGSSVITGNGTLPEGSYSDYRLNLAGRMKADVFRELKYYIEQEIGDFYIKVDTSPKAYVRHRAKKPYVRQSISHTGDYCTLIYDRQLHYKNCDSTHTSNNTWDRSKFNLKDVSKVVTTRWEENAFYTTKVLMDDRKMKAQRAISTLYDINTCQYDRAPNLTSGRFVSHNFYRTGKHDETAVAIVELPSKTLGDKVESLLEELKDLCK
ncbi:MAG: hypothetical protein ACPGJV_10280 [Bacteriovoracaceae bacterium]